MVEKERAATRKFMAIKTIRIAKTESDIQKALYVRWLGYKKYCTFKEPTLETLDKGLNCTILLAEDGNDKPIGTLRVLDNRSGSIELDEYVDVKTILPSPVSESDISIAEATRFSIPRSEHSRELKLLLWKAFFNLCRLRGIDYMVAGVKPSGSRDYRYLMFTNAGSTGIFKHSSLGGLVHHTFYANVQALPSLYMESKHPLADFFLKQVHECIDLL